jgi:hypothetical protein
MSSLLTLCHRFARASIRTRRSIISREVRWAGVTSFFRSPACAITTPVPSCSTMRLVSPRAMFSKMVGVGSQYALAFVDAESKPLGGSKTYKLHLPPNIPAKDFWSLVVYDNQTRSELQTDQQFPSIGSQKKGIVVNPDTSVDVYFAPTAPAGHEDN